MAKEDPIISLLYKKIKELEEIVENLSQQLSQKELEAVALKNLAMICPITGMFNLNYLNMEIARIRAAKERDFIEKSNTVPIEYVSAIFIDVDGLKVINDTYGHPIGNMVLREIGKILQDKTRRNDIAAHIHGDEFVVMSLSIKRSDSKILERRIREAMKEILVKVSEKLTISTSASVGYCVAVLKTSFLL